MILCLPDEAARQAVALIENPAVRVIDASSAYRVAPDWVYGFAEAEPDGYERIAAAKRVSNGGCWATGFLALVRPLVRAGLVPADFPVSAHGVSGYSGGGKTLIAEFEKAGCDRLCRNHLAGLCPGPERTSIFPRCNCMRASRIRLCSRRPWGVSIAACWWKCRYEPWALPGKTGASRELHAALMDAYQGRPLIEVASLEEAASAQNCWMPRMLAGSSKHQALCLCR